jgi:outer membrane protein OmpA-like peptidoglycan-associated protein
MRIAPVLPGITRFDASGVIDAAVRTLVSSIEAAVPLFVKGTPTLVDGGEQVVREQIARLKTLDALARVADRQFTIELIGQADADGPPDANLPLSERRAAQVLRMVPAQQFPGLTFAATGIGSSGAADALAPETEKQRNRRVVFRVTRATGER